MSRHSAVADEPSQRHDSPPAFIPILSSKSNKSIFYPTILPPPMSTDDLVPSDPMHTAPFANENTQLLSRTQSYSPTYTRDMAESPSSIGLSRADSANGDSLRHRYGSRIQSGQNSPVWLRNSGLRTPKLKHHADSTDMGGRVWYDQFTSTDWVHDSIADGYRVLELRKRKGLTGKVMLIFDSVQGWILAALVGCFTAAMAYLVDVTESSIFDLKFGLCQNAWQKSRARCCARKAECHNWRTWSQIISTSGIETQWLDYAIFITGCVVLASLSCFLTLYSKTVVPSQVASTFDENLAAIKHDTDRGKTEDPNSRSAANKSTGPANIYYAAAGSGVAEVKVILSGFVLHGYLGFRTLVIKAFALILSVSSGMSLGKEGPYVHIATCLGNIACRLFSKYNLNDSKRREVLSASAASGVAVAFGSPLGGVLFSLEEVSYYFPPKTLFRTFCCCIVAALSLKFLDPYGTSKIVLFEVRYTTDWRVFEIIIFMFLGCLGGVAGALFIKASRFWATTFRRIPVIKAHPLLEVFFVALFTGTISFWNRYTRLAVAELLFELASPCTSTTHTGLCPKRENLPGIISNLTTALIIKAFLTIITFGLKIPAGIYVPSMVVGGLIGRIVGHSFQYLIFEFPDLFLWRSCSTNGSIESCITPGVYALVAAGATMCGVTRLSVTLAVILFELTGSLDHVLPFSLAVLCAKWTADAVEPLSIYDLLTDMNSYPFLDNRTSPVFDSELSDITPRIQMDRVIDVTISPLIKASELRSRLNGLQNVGELDGGLPIIRDKILVGLIPAPDLEFALDRIENEGRTLCLIFSPDHAHSFHGRGWEALDYMFEVQDDETVERLEQSSAEPVDLTGYVDPAPIALDVHSPMDLVYQCFVKLGLRYICVLREGEYQGLVHKKAFVRYVKELEHNRHHS